MIAVLPNSCCGALKPPVFHATDCKIRDCLLWQPGVAITVFVMFHYIRHIRVLLLTCTYLLPLSPVKPKCQSVGCTGGPKSDSVDQPVLTIVLPLNSSSWHWLDHQDRSFKSIHVIYLYSICVNHILNIVDECWRTHIKHHIFQVANRLSHQPDPLQGL